MGFGSASGEVDDFCGETCGREVLSDACEMTGCLMTGVGIRGGEKSGVEVFALGECASARTSDETSTKLVAGVG